MNVNFHDCLGSVCILGSGNSVCVSETMTTVVITGVYNGESSKPQDQL